MLKTKLNKPTPGTKLIFRKELIDKLENGKEKKLTLVSAPAGYGKSTAVSQWMDCCCLPFLWYSLDKSDNDINNFLRYTIAGIRSVYKDIGAEAIKLIESNSNLSFETIATHIINDLYEIQEHFYIIFDDYHLIDNQQINQLISFLLHKLPDHVHIVLITRSDPSIPLARLRSQQLVTDIRLSDLCLNSQDIYDFFKKSLQIDLSVDEAKSLETKTEGWIAGLQLAGLSLQGKESPGNIIKNLKGDNRYIMDYLIEEVLHQHSPQIRDFLLCTSVLNQFNASLCNHMLNTDNGQEVIEQLEQKNMFLIPLDNERNWFRYHHLFASLLQQQLSLKLKERIPELHASACEWFENNDQLVFALEHSLAAGNKHKALNHFANVIDELWKTSQYRSILRFGGMFTHRELVENADLCFNYFWILFQSGYIEQAESLINMLVSHTTDKAELAMAYVCINNLKVFTGDIDYAYSYSELGMQHITKDADYWNILAYLSLGELHFLRFDLSGSFQSFDLAARRASASELIYFEMINRTRASFILWTQGDFSGAYEADRDLLEKFSAAGANNSFGIDILCSVLNCRAGNFLINTNQVEEGLQKSIRGYDLSKKTTNTLFIVTCTYLLAKAYYMAGEYNRAIRLVEELDAISCKQVTKYLCVLTDALKTRLYLVTNKQDKLKPLFEKDIKTDKNHAFEAIVYKIDRSRYQIAQGKLPEAIDLLQDVSEELESEKAYGFLVETELLQARVHSLMLEQEKAIDYLLRALLRTQSAGLIRIYINEGSEIENLLKKIKQIVSTRTDPQFKKADIDYISRLLRVFEKEKSRLASPPDDSLSNRELETLKLIAENLSNQEIADELYISITTVKTHVRNILIKLEARNRNEAVLKAKENGILFS